VAELHERDVLNAILRYGSLSQWFTQDVEGAQFVAEGSAGGQARTRTPDSARCLPTQVNALRLWLHRTRRAKAEILGHYKVSRLEELSTSTADRFLTRLMELGRHTPRTAG
jgi:hypothetical protein